MAKLKDLIGQRFSRLLVVEHAHSINYRHSWSCRCDCGKTVVALGSNLRTGKTRSCGCLMKGCNSTHGLSRLPEYAVWSTMIQRCTNKNNKRYHCYGGRGISVCEKWRTFHEFFEDMGPRPSKNHSIDRINNDGNYEPGNVRWATGVEQANNKRFNNVFSIEGRIDTLANWARLLNAAPYSLVWQRVKNGMDVRIALQAKSRHSQKEGK